MPHKTNLSEPDKALIQSARQIIARRFREDYHHIGAALRTRSGQTVAAVHLEANVGRIAVCAEAVALGMAAAAGDTEIETVVAVDEQGNVVAPCGMCRELIADYAPEAVFILAVDGELERVPVDELLPHKYQ